MRSEREIGAPSDMLYHMIECAGGGWGELDAP